MKVAIIGQSDRAAAWENHLRGFQSVNEVYITQKIRHLKEVDACILVDDSDKRLIRLLKILKLSYPTFLISKISDRYDELQAVHAVSQEAGVPVQFAHWPTFAAASHWMRQQMKRPRRIHVTKHLVSASFSENKVQLTQHWLDEVGLFVKWMDSGVQKVSVSATRLSSCLTSLDMMLHFESGATATLSFSLTSAHASHVRTVADSSIELECDVATQQVRSISVDKGGYLTVKKHNFDPSQTAELSIGRFLKAVQHGKSVAFSSFDAIRTAAAAKLVQQQLDMQ